MDTKSKPSRSGKQQRRRHSVAFKRRLIEQTLTPGVSVARIALENGVNTNLLFKWRRDHVRVQRVQSPALLPVSISEPSAGLAPMSPPAARAAAGGVIEIELAGARIRVKGSVDLAALRMTLQMLSPTQP